jgi:hypothetical protein
MALKDRWPLKEGSIHMKFNMTGSEKCDLFNTGDCLIEMITWAGLTTINRDGRIDCTINRDGKIDYY